MRPNNPRELQHHTAWVEGPLLGSGATLGPARPRLEVGEDLTELKRGKLRVRREWKWAVAR